MCTCFIKKGKDLLFGYNLDIDPAVWNYSLNLKKDSFFIGIKVGSTTYKTHGVNNRGDFGNLPYMNGPIGETNHRGRKFQRIDLLVDKLISKEYRFKDLQEIVKTKDIVNIKGCSMHSLFGNKEGNILLVEPGLGYKEIKANFGIITNFPIMQKLEDYSFIGYGYERYLKASKILKNSKEDFSYLDGLKLLEEVKQEGHWATRVSFVYSLNDNAVYYCLNNDFTKVYKHQLEKNKE